MTWGVNEWVAVASAVVAVVSLVLNWLVVRRQTQLQFETLKVEMEADVVAWVHEAVDLLAEAELLARGRGTLYSADEFPRRARETGQKLSAVADRGRMFFPNDAPDKKGREKEAAFQGYRQPILDAVIFACGLLDRLAGEQGGADEAAVALLLKCRRLLISEAQNAVDPRRRNQMLRQLAVGRMDDKKSAFAMAAELGEAMEARYPGYLVERRDANWIATREAMSRKRR